MAVGVRLRSHLIALVLAVIVRMVVFAAIVVVMFGRQQRADAERWKDIILLAPDGRQLVNTARPWGAPLPSASEPASLEAVVLTRRPVVGDIARGRLSGEYAVPVRVPVIRNEQVAYVLTGVLKPAALGSVLARQRIPADWIGSVFDRGNTIVVRTRSVEESLGRSLSPDFVAVLGRGAPEGWAIARTLDHRERGAARTAA